MAKVKPSPTPKAKPEAAAPARAKARPAAVRKKAVIAATAEPEALGARGTARRDAMLTAALAVFLEHGYEGASIEEVMRRVGGSKASLYRYFGSKEGLFGDIIEAGCSEFMSGFRVPTQADDDIARMLKDGFASAANTQRQWDYAKALHHDNVWTPQVVVNGRSDLVGANAAALAKAGISRRPSIWSPIAVMRSS